MYICFLSFQLSWFGTLDIDRIIYMYIYIYYESRERERVMVKFVVKSMS